MLGRGAKVLAWADAAASALGEGGTALCTVRLRVGRRPSRPTQPAMRAHLGGPQAHARARRCGEVRSASITDRGSGATCCAWQEPQLPARCHDL